MPSRPKPDTAPLTLIEQRFLLEYLVDLNATRAYRATHPRCASTNAAAVEAGKLLRKPHVAAALVRAQQDWIDRTHLTADRVAKDIDAAANLDTADLFDAENHLLPIRLMPPHVRRAIVSVEVAKRKAWGHTYEYVHKVKLIDKGKMHEVLARHTGVDKGEGQHQADAPAFALPADTPGVSVH